MKRRFPDPGLFLKSSMLVAASVAAIAQTTITVNANDPRPLATAAAQLEKQVGVAIDFEDIPYAFIGDIADVSGTVMTPGQRAANPNAQILVPKGGQLSIAPAELSNPGIGNITPLVASLLNAQNAAGLPGTYAYTFANGAFFITPTQARNQAGSVVAVVPILDTSITMPTQERSAAETLDAVLAQLTQKGVRVMVGSVPLALMLNSKITIGAENETARSVIARMFSALASAQMADGSTATLLGYQLLFDPGLKYYMFNAHVVSRTTQPVSAVASPLSAPTASRNPYGSTTK